MQTVGIRLDGEIIDLLDAEKAKLERDHPGMKVSRSDAARILLEEAINARKKAAARR